MPPTVLEFLVRARGVRAAMRLTLAGAVLIAAAEALIFIGGETYPLLELPYVVWLLVLPSACVIASGPWASIHLELLQQLGWKKAERKDFVDFWFRRIFCYSKPMLIVIVALVLPGMVSITILPPPYVSPLSNAVAWVSFAIVLVSAAVFFSAVLQYVRALVEMVRKPSIRGPRLLAASHPAMARLERYWLLISLFATLGFAAIAFATRSGRYEGQVLADVWVSIAALAPILLAGVGLFLIASIRNGAIEHDRLRVLPALRKAFKQREGHQDDPTMERVASMVSVFELTKSQGGLPTFARLLGPLLIALVPSGIEIFDRLTSTGA